MKRYAKWLTTLLAVCLLAGCGGPADTSSTPENSEPVTTQADGTTISTALSASGTEASVTTEAATSTHKQTSASVKPSSTRGTSVTRTAAPTTTTAMPVSTTSTAANPNRVTVNGREYAVGDVISYTVMVKTAQPYGTVSIGLRYVQKGLTVPQANMPIQQMQYVMQNLGIGNLGTGPEDTIGIYGFAMTSNKGRSIDTSRDGYAGLMLFFETNDRENGVSKNIDCSKGVALFTAKLKITKPGEYIVDCMEYSSNPRGDLTVWGEITA